MVMKQARFCEPLDSGGELIVTAEDWGIQYYFSGPDLRHNGESIYIAGSDIDSYIEAYKNNFAKYLTLKQTIPSDGDFTTRGECRMNIGVGMYREGVTISQWYNHLRPSRFPIRSQEDLDAVVFDYNYCKERAEEIKKLLFG